MDIDSLRSLTLSTGLDRFGHLWTSRDKSLRKARSGMPSQADPAVAPAYPDLGHRHPELLGSGAAVDGVDDLAAQHRGVRVGDHLDLGELLTVPAVGATGVGLHIGLAVEALAGVGEPAELGMQHLAQLLGITGRKRGRTQAGRFQYLLGGVHQPSMLLAEVFDASGRPLIAVRPP